MAASLVQGADSLDLVVCPLQKVVESNQVELSTLAVAFCFYFLLAQGIPEAKKKTHEKRADKPATADDVAVDPEGNAYITDAKSSKTWRVDINSKLDSMMRNDLFKVKELYKDIINLNGILYHSNGYFLIIHTTAGRIYKAYTSTNEASIVKVKGSLLMEDGMEMITPNKIVVAGFFGTSLVETDDDWVTALRVYTKASFIRFRRLQQLKMEKYTLTILLEVGL